MTKEELKNKKDEMKDRISMALKDPILQQGFEIICKNLADLEKENAVLREFICDYKEQVKNDNETFNNKIAETQELLDKQIEATYKLDKENVELKEKLKPENCLKLLAKDGYIKFTSEQLTKAKEIIKALLQISNENGLKVCDVYGAPAIIKQAEDFIKES